MGNIHEKGNQLVQPNFQFEKRQKELARKKKQEEKKLRKQEERSVPAGEGQDTAAQELYPVVPVI